MVTRRQEQNRALRDVQTLADIMPQLLKEATHVILRNDFTSGQRTHKQGELGSDPKKPWQEDMTGSPPPHHGDPTGEDACWSEMPDRTGAAISNLCTKLNECLNSALEIHGLSNTDVRVRAKRTMPDCLACGDQCIERVISGFDNKCYQRFLRAGRPERSLFIATIKAERVKQKQDALTASDMDKRNVH